MAIIVVLLVASLLVTGLGTLALVRSYLMKQTDQKLVDASATLKRASADGYGSATQQTQSLPSEYSITFHSADGRHAINILPAKDDAPDLSHLTLANTRNRAEHPFTVRSTGDGDGWRVIALAGTLGDESGSIAVALPMHSVNGVIKQAALVILGVGLLMVLLASLIAYLSVTRAFRPLRRVEKTAAAIAAGDLSRRVEVENPNTEIGHLSRSLNAMLAHVEASFAARTESERNMRRFVADASHELRTPLVTIRGFSELYRHGAMETEEDVRTAMGRMESEAKRMGELVEDLLMLARIDEKRPLQLKPVDLMLLGNDAVVDAQASAPDRVVRMTGLDGGHPQPVPVQGDEARLRQVMGNLVTNALRYTPAGSPLEIVVGVEPVIDDRKDSVIEVRDHGPGISDAEASRVFERFYRADTSRTRVTGGSGLGLAIVAAIVAQHDGTVRLRETPGGGATMSIRLPFVVPDDSRADSISGAVPDPGADLDPELPAEPGTERP